METTVKEFLRDYEQKEYRVNRDKWTREELEQYIRLDDDDEVYIDVRHDGTLIAIAGADSHCSSKIRVIEGLRGDDTTIVDALSDVQTDKDGTTTAVTQSGREIVVSPEWDVWSDSAGGFDGWYGVNVSLDGNDYAYCPDWAGADGNELRIVDIVRHGFFAACIKDNYEPGEYKGVDDYLCSEWPWVVIQEWFDGALEEALEIAKKRYQEKGESLLEEEEEEE